MGWSDSEREALTQVERPTADQWAGEDDDWLTAEARADGDADPEEAVRAFRGLLFGLAASALVWALIALAVLGLYGLVT